MKKKEVKEKKVVGQTPPQFVFLPHLLETKNPNLFLDKRGQLYSVEEEFELSTGLIRRYLKKL